jgi:hypothetical protein
MGSAKRNLDEFQALRFDRRRLIPINLTVLPQRHDPNDPVRFKASQIIWFGLACQEELSTAMDVAGLAQCEVLDRWLTFRGGRSQHTQKTDRTHGQDMLMAFHYCCSPRRLLHRLAPRDRDVP